MPSRLHAALIAVALAMSGVVVSSASASAEETPNPPDTVTDLPLGTVSDVLVDDERGQVFVSLTAPDSVAVVDFDGTARQMIALDGTPTAMVLGPDGGSVHVAELGASELTVIDARTFALSTIALPSGQCARSLASTGGRIWYGFEDCATHTGGGLGTVDPATGQAADTGVDAPRADVHALPDRPDRLFVTERVETAGAFHVFDVSSGAPVEVGSADHAGCVDAALLNGGDHVVGACGSGYEFFKTADLSRTRVLGVAEGKPSAVAVDTDGRLMATAETGVFPVITVRRIADGAPQQEIRRYRAVTTWGWKLHPRSLEFAANGWLIAAYSFSYGDRVVAPQLRILREPTRIQTSISMGAPYAVDYRQAVRLTGALSRGPGVETTVSITRSYRWANPVELGSVPVAANGSFTFTDTPGASGPYSYTATWAGDAGHLPAQGGSTVRVNPLPFDFNGDGFAETVVAAPGEDIGSDKDTGTVHILPGTASGAAGTASIAINQDSTGVPGSGETGDGFGKTTASGDFNGDGHADLAVAAPGEDLGSARDAGQVIVFFGRPDGSLQQYPTALNLIAPGAGDSFGAALTVGDFDADGFDDLVVGAPGKGAGQAFLYNGPLERTSVRVIKQGDRSVPGKAETGDRFGEALAAGDINADGNDDLVIGAPGDKEDTGRATGVVTLMYGSSGSGPGGGSRLSKATPGVPGTAGGYDSAKGDDPDRFGAQVALSDLNGDGKADLAVTAPGAAVTGTDGKRKADAGTLNVLYSDGKKIGPAGAVQITQATSGVPGNTGADDKFGKTLASADVNGDRIADLAVYSPADTLVTVFPGSGSGVVPAQAKVWTQDTAGIPGSTETGDDWGATLRFLDITGTGYHALVVGAPGENGAQGAATVIYSTSTGLAASGSDYLSQDTPGIAGTAENGDRFGGS
ncbi:FG-GAP repeat protein [Phytomonospora sp. NPDC050363]|uniref:FG-GAP repeat protein n=1 Tax=Phytomonospora sp. NPDC050363 TaxID=3155642 RepID=UPI0033C9E8E8